MQYLSPEVTSYTTTVRYPSKETDSSTGHRPCSSRQLYMCSCACACGSVTFSHVSLCVDTTVEILNFFITSQISLMLATLQSHILHTLDFPGGSLVRNPFATGDAGDRGSIPGSERSPEGGNHNSLQCSCLENHVDRGAWRATVHGVAKELDTTEWLSMPVTPTSHCPQSRAATNLLCLCNLVICH